MVLLPKDENSKFPGIKRNDPLLFAGDITRSDSQISPIFVDQ